MKLTRKVLLGVVASIIGVGVVYAALEANPPTEPSLSGFAPQGALLAIESPDFAGLLRTWNASAEQKRWLAGDDYAEFSRSRLFGRLGAAQSEFATAAGLAPDTKFLEQVAGGQSLFAWYDIGNLEFLYITRIPAGQAEKSPLMQLRNKFEQRREGDNVFYVRSSTDAASQSGDDSSNSDSTGGKDRTVAFAVHGDYLLLATREDLIANALDLMQKQGGRSLQTEGWYASAAAAAGNRSGELRMTLNLEKIVPSPAFRSYWVQQNITEMKQYRAAVSDLFHDGGVYREERVLLPSDPAAPVAGTELSPLLNLLPAYSGVYRAEANPSIDEAIEQLEQKVISRRTSDYRDPHVAPVADLSTPISGDASDLERRIDEPLATPDSQARAVSLLRASLTAATPTGMLVFSSAAQRDSSSSESVFLPVNTAVALMSDGEWSDTALQQGLSHALHPDLSASDAGLTWQQMRDASGTWYQLDGAQPLAYAVRGHIFVLASDAKTLQQLLSSSQDTSRKQQSIMVASGFDFSDERPAFNRLIGLLDRTTGQSRQSGDAKQMFFSGNVNSLGVTFQDMTAETFVQSMTPDHVTHQVVSYQYRQR